MEQPAGDLATLAAAVEVEVDDAFIDRVDAALLRGAVAAAVCHARGAPLEAPRGTLATVSIVDDAAIRSMNRDFRGKDVPTDVLSFPADEAEAEFIVAEEALAAGAGEYLGDIVISFPRAEAQAVEYGHPLDRELAFLAVHGALHLLGHDHETEPESRAMRAAEEAVMAHFPGLARPGA